MKQNPVIRTLASEDYEALARFNASFPGDSRSEKEWIDRFHHWWDNNPAYDEEWKRGFILLDDEEIVGFVGSFPTLFKVGDQILKAFNGTTWRVMEEYRKYSVDLWSYNREISKHYFSFNTTPTDDVIKMIKRIKYFKVPWGEEKQSFLVGNPSLFAEKLPAKIPKIVRIAMSFALKIYQAASFLRIKSPYQVKEIEGDLSHINDLWQKSKNQYEYTNVRDAESIAWYAKGKILKGIFSGEDLIATAIYLRSSTVADTQNLVLADFWHDHEESLHEILSALLLEDLRNIKRQKHIQLVRYPHFSPQISSVFDKLRIPSKPYQSTNFLRIPNRDKAILNTSNSFFSFLQGDFGV